MEIHWGLETIFKALYDDRVVLDPPLEAALLQGYDCLRMPLETQIDTGVLDHAQVIAQVDPILSHLETLLGDSLYEAESFMPTSQDLGVDIVASIFEVDVAQGLDRWAMVLEDPESYPVAGELRAQLEVFMGLSEILELPGFGELTQTSLQALDRYPDRHLEILALVLEDFRQARHQVLQGDRQQGGSASAALVALAQGQSPETWGAVDPTLADVPSLADVFGAEVLDEALESDSLGADSFGADRFGAGNFGGDSFGGDAFSSEGFGVDRFEPEIAGVDTQGLTTAPLEGFSLGEIPSLEDVFGADLEESEPAPQGLDPMAFGDPVLPIDPMPSGTMPLSELSLGEVPSLDDVFGDPGFEDEHPADPVSPGIHNSANPHKTSLELNLPDRQSVEQTIVQAQIQFDQLPPLAPQSDPSLMAFPSGSKSPSSSPDPAPPAAEPVPKIAPPAPGRSLRVDLQRLERMNNLVGELVINRNSLALQNDRLQGSVGELADRFDRFQDLLGQLRLMADRLLVEARPPRLIGAILPDSKSPAPQTIAPFDLGEVPEFDQLEMDRYTGLHSQLQEIFEQVLQLEESISDVNLFASQSSRSLIQQQQQLNALQNELMWSRMLPLGEVFNRLPRILRDLCHRFQKSVNLKLAGTAVLVDKSILEKLYDPLLHLIRNAFDHGVEPVEERQRHGKPPEATIEIRAYHRGNYTLIEVQNDGRGINLEKISQRAISMGWVTPEALPTLKPEQLYSFLFESGFSTAGQVTDLSGRGVGLDVVKSEIEALKGSVSITSKPHQGTTFTLRLPLTLTLTKLLIVQAGHQLLALPSDNLDAIVIPQPHHLKSVGSNTFVHWRESLIPHYNLEQLLNYTCPLAEMASLPHLSAVQAPSQWLPPLLIIRRGAYGFALEVDRLLTEQELVIKPFNPAISPPPYLYGCTVLGDGRLVPVMDAVALLDHCLNPAGEPLLPAGIKAAADALPSLETAAIPTILVVDDSAALRRTLALTLQKGGYRVLQARDGLEALEQLQQYPGVNLIICDVEMPNMNGFEFLSQRRREPHLAQIPVFMLTSRSNDKHRQLARTLGAKSYFTKPYLEQELLTALQTELQQPLTAVNSRLPLRKS